MKPEQSGEGFAPPGRIGNYRIEERLGSGGMGVVYRAFDEALRRPLAIKHLLANRTNSTASLRFRREAQAAARLNHPAIVHIYDIVETEAGDWIVMELVEGTPLSQMIPEGKLDLQQAIRLGREIAEGLAEAHAQGVIHRDLKAANVMITASGRAKILDFGLAKLMHHEGDADLSQTGIVLGTYHAMSPEQLQGLPLDHRSDLFSLGSLLYEMLTGVSPFRGGTINETLTRICTYHPPAVCRTRSEIPQALSNLIDWLLQKNPARRPAGAGEVARSLAGFEAVGRAAAAALGAMQRADVAEEATLVDGIFADHHRVGSAPEPRPLSRPSAVSRPSSERRQVTVVCCELVGGGGSSPHTFDPEALHELMFRLRTLTEEVTRRYDGHLGGILDGRMLIYFGFPQSHEDNAQRAVRAALELVDQVAQMADSDREQPILLGLRAGVHTGPAVVTVAPQGLEPMSQPLTLGATLDIAVALQSLAKTGCVVVSPATCSLIERSFSLEALSPVLVAGLNSPLIPRRVLEPLESPEDSSAGLPLLGRDREMELLLSRWDLACEGNGQVILISGEAGIGKSHLVQALREHLKQGQAQWWSCFASPYTQNSPLQPVIGLLRQALLSQGGTSPLDQLESSLQNAGLAEAVPLFASLLDVPLDDRHAAPNLPPERQREKTLEALAALVVQTAERQPLVLLIEDLHWLDPTTLGWLDRLIDQAPTVPLFFLLTLRLHTVETVWAPRAHLTQILLNPLSQAEAERLVDRVTGERLLPAAVRRQIVARTDGVPLFLEELTKAVLESHESGERRELPATLRDSLAARLDRLGTAKEVAQIAAVIGRVFAVELLAALYPGDEQTLQQELRRLVQAELVHRRGFGRQARYLFKHALVQDAAYDSLLKRERQKIHRQIAETLESRFSDIAETQPEILAHHYTEAGLTEPAIDSWYRAGLLANSRSAGQEAISHLERALQLLENLPEDPERDRRELKIQIALAAATIARGSFLDRAVARAYSRAEVLAERLQETEERFWAAQGLHTYHLMLGDFPPALVYAELFQRIAKDSGSPTLLAIACYWLGIYHYYRADFVRALPELERAYELAPPEDASYRVRTGADLRVLALSFQALVLWHLGYPERAQSRGEQAIALARDLGPFTLSFARGIGGAVLGHYLRDADAVRREAREVHDLAVELGFHMWIWQTTYLLAWVDLYAPTDGSLPFELGDHGSPQAVEQVAGVSMDYYFCLYIEILLLQGRTGEALETLEHARSRCQARGFLAWSGELDRLQGEILQSVGEPEEVERLFRTAIDRARQCASRSLELRGALSLGRVWRDQGRSAAARDLVTSVYRTFTEGFDSHDLRQARDFLDSCSMEEAT